MSKLTYFLFLGMPAVSILLWIVVLYLGLRICGAVHTILREIRAIAGIQKQMVDVLLPGEIPDARSVLRPSVKLEESWSPDLGPAVAGKQPNEE